MTVTCPPGLALTGGGGCAPTGRCGVADVAEQAAACMAVGDAACCSSALIVREYEQLAAGVAQLPESRAELRGLAERACTAGMALACEQAAQLGAEPRAHLLRRACELGALGACGPQAPAAAVTEKR